MKIKINKKALSILLSSFILVASKTVAKITEQNNSVFALKNVNIRLENSIDSEKIGLFKENEKAIRLLSDDEWDLIIYNNIIGYVKNEFVAPTNEKTENYKYEEKESKLYTNVNLNIRLKPDIESDKIGRITKYSKFSSIALVNDDWYLIRYNNIIGFVKAEYVKEEKYSATDFYYLSNSSLLYDENGNIIKTIEKCEIVNIISYKENYSLVETDKYIGYIANEDIKKAPIKFVEVDIDDQKVRLYDDNKILIESNIVTGSENTPTRVGSYYIYSKETDRYLKGPGYNSHVNFWMPFDGGIGLHDASWRNKFGDKIYIRNGSHGCVNMSYDTAEFIYENTDVGTKVLVHK